MTHGRKVENPAKRPQEPQSARAQAGAPFRLAATVAFTVVAIAILLGPLTAGGVWDPVELRVADLASRIAAALFHAQDIVASGNGGMPTLGELGRGELPFTSIALSFRVFGMHDWSGRLPLALWVVAALIAQVAWVSRFVSARAAAWSALVFCTMPLAFFQARVMLGDATTIGTSAISFVLLSFACLPGPAHRTVSTGVRIVCAVLGLAVATLGVLARGVAIGVAVPALAVSVAYLATARPKSGQRLALALSLLVGAIGVGAAVVGLVIALGPAPERGILLVMQGTARAAPAKMPTFESVVTQLGHGLFPWSAVLPFALATVVGRLCRQRSRQEAAAISAVVLFVIMNGATQTLLVSIGAAFPFAAVVGIAIVIGIWLGTPEIGGSRWRALVLGVLALMVIALADFDNLPDKLLAASTAADAKLPASFKNENQLWLRGCAGVFGTSFLVTLFGVQAPGEDTPLRDLIRVSLRAVRQAWGGQVFFFGLLIETSLVTGALLVTATRLGAPFQRILYMSATQREIMTWAWVALPALAVASLILAVLYRALVHFYAPALGLMRWASEPGMWGRFARLLLDRIPRLQGFRIEQAAVLRIGLVLAASLVSLGWAGRLSQQLSPRRALNRYHAVARRGEPLALLGVRPQVTQYYSSERPEVLLDADEAADWLLFSHATQRRWLLVKGEQFARFNASFREKCQCARNATVVDGRSSELFLVTNEPVPLAADENPLRHVVLERAPEPQQKIDGNFGDQVEAIGWDLVTADGRAVSELRPGRNYELQLYFRVLSRPTLDWEIFVHIDGYGRRFNGDHDASNGLYPMSNWRPGDYIVDRSPIDLDPSFTEGNYDLYFGFFKGSRRLEVKRGNHDDNRLLAGKIRVM